MLLNLAIILFTTPSIDGSIKAKEPADLIGRKVWVNGSVAYVGKDKLAAWSMLEPALIAEMKIEKHPEAEVIPSPPIWNTFHGSGPTERRGSTKITVKLILPKSARLISNEDTGLTRSISHELFSKAAKIKNQPTAWLFAQDLDHLLMQLSITHIWNELAYESAAIQSAFKRREVEPGMPRRLVVRLLGYPSYLKPASSQHFDKTWTWPAHTIDSYEVGFGRDGRVDSAGVNWSQLP